MNEQVKQQLTTLGMEAGTPKTFSDANEAASALIQLKTTIMANGFNVDSESVNGDELTCNFKGGSGTMTATQNVKTFTITVS